MSTCKKCGKTAYATASASLGGIAENLTAMQIEKTGICHECRMGETSEREEKHSDAYWENMHLNAKPQKWQGWN
jgi:hypothetical protein